MCKRKKKLEYTYQQNSFYIHSAHNNSTLRCHTVRSYHIENKSFNSASQLMHQKYLTLSLSKSAQAMKLHITLLPTDSLIFYINYVYIKFLNVSVIAVTVKIFQ